MINFSRAFDLAWERMQVILFGPFDFGKWCAIGFSAFLAGLLSGGNGFNSGSFNRSFDPSSFKDSNISVQTQGLPDWSKLNGIGQAFAGLQVGVIVLLVLVIVAVVFAFILLLYWLGSRGQFMFLDNIVRNRGAVSEPWSRYARQANSVFAFYVLFMALSLVVMIPILIIGVVMGLPLFREHRWPIGGEIAGFAVLGVVYLGVLIVYTLVLFLFREFGIPIMFRQGLLARPAFMVVMNLVRLHPGSVTLFVLLRLALAIAVAIVSIIVCCASCCAGMIPYVGTVMLLPALVYVRCFTFDCLAQFGPEYDVWTVDVTPPGFRADLPLNPLRPPG